LLTASRGRTISERDARIRKGKEGRKSTKLLRLRLVKVKGSCLGGGTSDISRGNGDVSVGSDLP